MCRKCLEVGYDATHTCETDSWIATFPIGYADGLWRAQGRGKGKVIRDKTGNILEELILKTKTIRLIKQQQQQ